LPITPTIIAWTPPPYDDDDADQSGDLDKEFKWTEKPEGGRKGQHQQTKDLPLVSLEDDLAWQVHNDTPHYHPGNCSRCINTMSVVMVLLMKVVLLMEIMLLMVVL
jgi:hypothetical protein